MKKKLNLKGVWQLLKTSVNGFIDNHAIKLSASLAYYTIFSLGPMLIVMIYMADIFWGRAAIEGTVYGQISGLVGSETALQIQEIIKNASLDGKSRTAGIIGIITLIIGATTVFAEIQDSINFIWGLKTKAERGWLRMLFNRLLSFSIVVSLGFLLLVSLVINGILEALTGQLEQVFPDMTLTIVYVTNLLLTLLVTSFLFAIIFKVLPDAKIHWRDVLVGSVVTALLFMLSRFLISFYIGRSDISSTYGTAGSLVVLLLWVYFAAIILYFGAEFTKAYATDYGAMIRPSQYAVWIKHVEVEEGRTSLKQVEKKKKEENDHSDGTVKVV
ncbi:MAG: YihY/virulence factor BrkB family protein [Chitinophagaceae bacterium]